MFRDRFLLNTFIHKNTNLVNSNAINIKNKLVALNDKDKHMSFLVNNLIILGKYFIHKCCFLS